MFQEVFRINWKNLIVINQSLALYAIQKHSSHGLCPWRFVLLYCIQTWSWLIGASVSEPHLDGTATYTIYVYIHVYGGMTITQNIRIVWYYSAKYFIAHALPMS